MVKQEVVSISFLSFNHPPIQAFNHLWSVYMTVYLSIRPCKNLNVLDFKGHLGINRSWDSVGDWVRTGSHFLLLVIRGDSVLKRAVIQMRSQKQRSCVTTGMV